LFSRILECYNIISPKNNVAHVAQPIDNVSFASLMLLLRSALRQFLPPPLRRASVLVVRRHIFRTNLFLNTHPWSPRHPAFASFSILPQGAAASPYSTLPGTCACTIDGRYTVALSHTSI
jgi:hypothetical protein